MSNNDIEQQINTDYKNFQSLKFEDNVPKGFIEKFKRAISALAPNLHQIHPRTITEIIAKKEKDLTNLEVGMIIKAIISAPLEKVFTTDFNKAIDELNVIIDLNIECNIADSKKKEELNQRKATLLNFAGANNGNVPKNILAKA